MPAPARAGAAGAGIASYRQVWAALFARVHGGASPAALMKWFGVRAETAHAMMADLVSKGVLSGGTTATGRVLATKPIYQGSAVPGARPAGRPALNRVAEALRGETDRILSDDDDWEEVADADEPEGAGSPDAGPED